MKYSVIIATYRRPRLLCQTLELLMPQVGAEGEVIVVEQDPVENLEPFLAGYQQIQHVILARPGTVNARNHAIRISRGEILIFIDDDVVPPAGFIQAHLAAYRNSLTIGGVAGRVIEASRPFTAPIDPRSLDPVDGWRWSTFDHDCEMDVPHAPTCNLSLRREVVVKVGGFDPRFRLAWREDSDLCFRIRQLGYRIRFSPSAWLIHLSATEGGTRGPAVQASWVGREIRMYLKHFLHYQDNLFFLCKHFRGRKRLGWLFDAYRSYVGFSRWPWRLAAKNAAFFVALWRAAQLARYRQYHSCTLAEGE